MVVECTAARAFDGGCCHPTMHRWRGAPVWFVQCRRTDGGQYCTKSWQSFCCNHREKDCKLQNTLWIAGKNEIWALYCKYVFGINILDFAVFYGDSNIFFIYINVCKCILYLCKIKYISTESGEIKMYVCFFNW